MSKSCACSGIRTCLRCENVDQHADRGQEQHVIEHILHQCYKCGLVKKADCDSMTLSSQSNPLISCVSSDCTEKKVLKSFFDFASNFVGLDVDISLTFQGMTLIKDFVSDLEEQELLTQIDKNLWIESQSGRLKQDYGPKVNFKRKKIKIGAFNGLPNFSKFLVHRMCTSYEECSGFYPVELCNLDYNSERGSAIDPHTDDKWLWGERLVTLNLLSNTILTFTKPFHDKMLVLNVPLPRRSLVIVEGSARHDWQHSIQRKHIISRRVAVTFRELSSDFKFGGCHYETLGRKLLEIATAYAGIPVK